MDCRKCVSFSDCNPGILIKPDIPIKLQFFTSFCSGFRFLGKGYKEKILKGYPVEKYESIDDYFEKRGIK